MITYIRPDWLQSRLATSIYHEIRIGKICDEFSRKISPKGGQEKWTIHYKKNTIPLLLVQTSQKQNKKTSALLA